ncbi:MAG TPA: DUF1326 domain-containing protein [Ktedonobacterales bacterium]|jgi:hypothetical protein|nr:DUF1326 domain-containing protein [Ktedonobacterales bacterium]
MATPATKTFTLDGTLLEACSCMAPCPCWIGDDPDGGSCDAFVAYHVDKGEIRGLDVSNLSLVLVSQIPGNVLAGNWRVVLYVDDKATEEQQSALLDVFGGKLGGTPADLAALVGEIVAVHPVPIDHRVEGGKGTLRVGQAVYAEMANYSDAQGRPTSLHESIFSTIPGSPAYVAKAATHQVNVPEHGMTWEFSGRNAVQGSFHFEA